MISKNAFRFIFITILIDCTGIGLIFPVMPDLIMEIGNVDISEATKIGGWLVFSYAIMQFVFAPVLGGLSDRFGRRPVLLLSLFGLGIDYIVLASAPDLTWLVIGRIIAGLCGASFSTGFAYVADISKPEDRAKNFGMMGAAFGLGFIIGPALGGLLGDFGLRVPFIAAAILSLLNFLYGYFILPESLSLENRRKFELKRANPFGSFFLLAKKPTIIRLVLGLFFIYLAGQTMPVMWSFYAKLAYGWEEGMIGLSLAFVGVCVAIVQGGLVGTSMKKLGELKTVYLGLFLYFIGLVLFTFAGQPWMMFAFTAVYACGGIAPPALQGILTSKIPSNEQGEIQGIMTSMQSLTIIINPLCTTSLFYYFTNENTPYFFPGVIFAFSAVLILVGAVVIVGALKSK